MAAEEGGHLFKAVDTLIASSGAVQRFYAVKMQSRDEVNKDEGSMDDRDQPAEQLWLLKLDMGSTEGKAALDAIVCLMEDNMMVQLMDATLRKDRAPQWSWARMLGDVLWKKGS